VLPVISSIIFTDLLDSFQPARFTGQGPAYDVTSDTPLKSGPIGLYRPKEKGAAPYRVTFRHGQGDDFIVIQDLSMNIRVPKGLTTFGALITALNETIKAEETK